VSDYSFTPIGYIRSCFTEKFGIPRQPGLVPEAQALVQITAPFNQPEAFRGLEAFSHVWLVFVFHAALEHKWKATVRPPRLGGNKRVGVFASRSGFRPNAIGQSAVPLLGIENKHNAILLRLGGVDVLDGTPVLDIKPYLPYADSIPEATAGYAPASPKPGMAVRFSTRAARQCDTLDPERYPALKALISNLLCQDPRPAYKDADGPQTYGMRLWDLNIRFSVAKCDISVESIERENHWG
jgi:tRNA-Thr(GGU) m(6)t(6)A37 methyltransferase TsaA